MTSKNGRGGRQYRPYAFTEQGVAMLSSVLKSNRAIEVNIQIIRSFMKLREILSGNEQLKLKLERLEQKYDNQFAKVFQVIKNLIKKEEQQKPPIGFRIED